LIALLPQLAEQDGLDGVESHAASLRAGRTAARHRPEGFELEQNLPDGICSRSPFSHLYLFIRHGIA